MVIRLLHAAVAVAAALLAASVVHGAAASAEPGQVARGRAIYQQNCMQCHGATGAGLNGAPTRARFGNAGQIFAFARRKMPFDRPGSLTDDEYWDTVAYILSLHGAAPRGELAPANAAEAGWDHADILVYVGTKRLATDVPPEIRNGSTLVPLRAIFEQMGSTIEWNAETQTITATRRETTVTLQIDSPAAQLNGQGVRLDQPPVISGGRTLVPARFIGEALGAKVTWNPDIRTVQVTPW